MAANTGIHRIFVFLLIIVAAAGADYLKVEFTKTLKVNTLTEKTYTTFLKELRKKLASTYSKKVPVLPVFNHDKPRGFDLVLTNSTYTTTARFRGDDLYFVGFQMQTGKKHWYEFKPKEKNPPHLIKGAEFLDFDGGYPTLEGIAGKVTNMVINKKALLDSAAVLAGSQDKGERARSSLVVIQMVSEAARFLAVSGHFASNLVNGAKLPEWMRKDLQNNWADLSYRVLKSEADACYKFVPPTIDGKVVKTVEALRGFFGIMYRDADTLKPSCTKSLNVEL